MHLAVGGPDPGGRAGFYEHFPAGCEVIFGSSITSTVNVVFSHWARRPRVSMR